MVFTDLHSHILPGVDDGARDLDEALAMLEIAERDGISTIAATPHDRRIDAASIADNVSALQRAARERGLAIDIIPGCEVRFDADLGERFRGGDLVSCNGTPWILLELSLRLDWPPYLHQGIYDLQVAGALPILAHAERYPAVQRQPDILLDLITQGVLIQVNADSITGGANRAASQTAERLLKRGMVHLIASDAHDTRLRPPRLSAAFARVAELTDPDYAGWLGHVARRIVSGEPVTPPEPRHEASNGLLGRLKVWSRR